MSTQQEARILPAGAQGERGSLRKHLSPARIHDMRTSETQSLSDGELFSIIEHGIRLTGMPAWGTGTPQGERDSWGLVHFIRQLPKLSAEDIERMEALNPKTPAQLKEEEETRRFLQGNQITPAPEKAPRD